MVYEKLSPLSPFIMVEMNDLIYFFFNDIKCPKNEADMSSTIKG